MIKIRVGRILVRELYPRVRFIQFSNSDFLKRGSAFLKFFHFIQLFAVERVGRYRIIKS